MDIQVGKSENDKEIVYTGTKTEQINEKQEVYHQCQIIISKIGSRARYVEVSGVTQPK